MEMRRGVRWIQSEDQDALEDEAQRGKDYKAREGSVDE